MKKVKDGPLATVRYTEYDEEAKPVKVNQVEYHDPDYFHSQVLQAVCYGLDVSIFTPLNVQVLKKKIRYWTN
jgi:hypothetical protein